LHLFLPKALFQIGPGESRITQEIGSLNHEKTIALILSFAVLVAVAHAQQSSVTVIAPNGGPVSVAVYVRPGLGDIARGGNGAILIDPQLLSLRWEFQFVLAHEAAHAIGIMNETAADYFAGQNLRISGFSPGQMQVVSHQ
jgi:hypothetical protein